MTPLGHAALAFGLIAGQAPQSCAQACPLLLAGAADTVPVSILCQVPENDASSTPGMVLIPAGKFTMGDPFSEGHEDERPTHAVHVSAFYMDQCEVSKALWDQVYGWAIRNGYSFDNAGAAKATNHPVQSVSWYDAVKWCNARSEMEQVVPAYYTSPAQTTVYRTGRLDVANTWVKWNAGYRLPTEAEWEKAARGGGAGKRYPWGNAIAYSQANILGHPTYATGPMPHTCPVGTFSTNGYGLFNISDNVSELCWDWHGSYDPQARLDPRGPTSGTARVFRPGSWGDDPKSARVANRDAIAPDNRTSYHGFRTVLVPCQP